MAVTKAQVTGSNQQSLTETDKQDIRDILGLSQESKIFTVNSASDLQTDIANDFNSLPTVNIKDISSVYLRVVLTQTQTTKIYKIISKPSDTNSQIINGNFGVGGQNITNHNLELIRQELQSTSEDLENAPGTVTEDFGDLGTTTIKDHINGLTTGLVIADSATNLTILKAEVDGLITSFLYTGTGDTYGVNDSTLQDSEIELLEQEAGVIPDNSIEEVKFTQAVRDKLNLFTQTLKDLYDDASNWVITNGQNVLDHIGITSGNPHGTNADQIDDNTTTNKFTTQADIDRLANTSGTNTGDQDLSDFETITELDTRDTNNRNRSNHTGTQSANTITGLSDVAISNLYEDLDELPILPSEIINILGFSRRVEEDGGVYEGQCLTSDLNLFSILTTENNVYDKDIKNLEVNGTDEKTVTITFEDNTQISADFTDISETDGTISELDPKGVKSINFTGTDTKTLTVTRNDDTTATADFTDINETNLVTSVNNLTGDVSLDFDDYNFWALYLEGSLVDTVQSTDDVNFIAGNNITITETTSFGRANLTISGGGTTFTEGTGIDINSSDVISVDSTVIRTGDSTLDSVTGNGNTTTNDITVGGLRLNNTNKFTLGSSGDGALKIQTNGSATQTFFDLSEDILYRDASDSFKGRMRFTNDGKLGIGDIVPSEKLEVDGNIKAASFVESSLKRLKENILPYNQIALQKVNNLDIVTFDKIDGVKDKIGIIADEETTDKDFLTNDRDGVDLYKSLFVQAKAIQELDAKVERQANEIQELKELVNKMIDNG